MPNNWDWMNNYQLKSYLNKLSKEVKAIENLYKQSISERLRVKLEVLDRIDLRNYQPPKPTGARLLEPDPEIYLSDLVIDNLVSEYGDLIDLDGSCVEFCQNYYGYIDTDAPPRRINPKSLCYLIKGRTPKNLDWSEVISKLLPFMKKYSHIYSNLSAEMFDIENEQQMRADYQEGAQHMNWLISEYGEDVFPDR
ncbi:MAG: hypothetical protein ACK5RE_06315 [Pseudanabaena sp.]|jgi:hypothetical protein